jgi:hypothetical protein
LDKKSLQLHKLQRSCIKAVCYAVGEGFKENIGYLVIDIRSAPDGIGKPKWFTLLQPKYPKVKPTIQINVYIEDDQNSQHPPTSYVNQNTDDVAEQDLNNSDHHVKQENNFLNSDILDINNKKLQVNLIESEGYFLIDKKTSNSSTYILTITISFARNLLRLFSNNQHEASSNFHFYYTFLNNQVTTKPFSDIVSCQINGERSSIRFHATCENLKKFFLQENVLEIVFCSSEHRIARGCFDWNKLVSCLNNNLITQPILIDYLLKVNFYRLIFL